MPPVCVSLPPSAVAHMTEAAAADYRFSCGGRAPSHSFLLSFSLHNINLFKAQGCQLMIFSGSSSLFQLFFSCILPFLPYRSLPFPCCLKIYSVSLLSNYCSSPSSQWVLPPTVYVILLASLVILLLLWVLVISLTAHINTYFDVMATGLTQES